MARKDPRKARSLFITLMRNGLIRVECHRPGCSWFRDFDPSDETLAETAARVHLRDCVHAK